MPHLQSIIDEGDSFVKHEDNVRTLKLIGEIMC